MRIVAHGGALNFDDGALIDVSKGLGGQTGSVTLTMARDSANVLPTHRLSGTVLSQRLASDEAATVAVEGQRSYTVGAAGTTFSVTAAQITGYANDHRAFITGTNAAAVTGNLKADGGLPARAVLRGATELRTAGDLLVAQAWDLTGATWLSGGQPGALSLRAAGNMSVSTAVGNVNDTILAGDTWSLRAVAGVDLAAANPGSTLALDRVAAGKGDLLLTGANAKLRTGTGRIDLAAARDVRIDNVRAVVYTGGRIGAADTEAGGNNRWAIDGGDITVQAGRDVAGPVSAAGDLWITEWLRRPRLSQAAFASLLPTDWWAYRPNFQQGLGTLAGGNIDVSAGRDVSNLAAMLPTTGRTDRDAAGLRRVNVEGGGDLRLMAGNNVVGGAYLIGRGQGRIDAAGDVGSGGSGGSVGSVGSVGTGRGVQLYVMGASSGNVPERAGFDVSAGNALNLQSINNPTVLAQFSVPGSSGPSFVNSGLLTSFFTYTANSRTTLRADGGDLSLNATFAPPRMLGTTPVIGASLPAAFPASLDVVAFNGSVVNTPIAAGSIVTFPSPSAQIRFLASESIPQLSLVASDRDPTTVSTPRTVQRTTQAALTQLMSGSALLAEGPQARILARSVDAPFIFDIQALTGNLGGSGIGQGVGLVLPARSRVRAGVDIVGAGLTLQNLDAADISEVRADKGDFRSPAQLEIRGPGRLLLQVGRNVDLGQSKVRVGPVFSGGLVASGNNANPNLPSANSARITVVAGVRGTVDLSKLDAAYGEIIAINSQSGLAQAFFSQLASETAPDKVLAATTVAGLAQQDSAYRRFVTLDTEAPRLLGTFQAALQANLLPLSANADAAAAKALYRLLNADPDVAKLLAAGSVAALANGPAGADYRPFAALGSRYPLLFQDYVQRRSKGALPTTLTPIVFSKALDAVVATVILPQAIAAGGISSFDTSIQTFGGSAIDLLAPNGNIVVGLTTPSVGTTIGVLTNSGGAIRSLVSGNFDINQGKVLTAQGGDILIFSSQGSIDAGRGAKTSLSTPPPTRSPVFADVDGERVVVGFLFTVPASASGSGIQTLTSDPDGTGPRSTPVAGNVYLFAPAGTIDAGEAGIRSGGNIVINAQTVLNASNISSSGSSVGVPQLQVGSLASAMASSGANPANAAKGGEEAAAADAARKAAATAPPPRPTILSVEVLGFGDKNCKEDDKECFAR